MDNPPWSPGWGRLGSAFTSALDAVLVDSKRLNQFFPCVQVLVGRANITAAAFCDSVPEGAQAGAMSGAAAVAALVLEPSRMPQAGAPPRPALSTSHRPCSRWEQELSTALCQLPAGESPELLGACWGHGIDKKKFLCTLTMSLVIRSGLMEAELPGVLCLRMVLQSRQGGSSARPAP